MNARLISMSRDTIVRHTDSYPNRSANAGTFTNHLHNPYFVRIGNGKRFTPTIISIFLYQISHNLYGFASSTRTLQSNINQTSIINNTRRIRQLGTTAESSFPNSDLIFIHIANHIISLTSLLDFSQIFTGVPFVHFQHGPFRIRSCRIMIKFSE